MLGKDMPRFLYSILRSAKLNEAVKNKDQKKEQSRYPVKLDSSVTEFCRSVVE